MAVFRCESCGAGLEIQEGERVAFCPYCGSKHIFPKDEAAKIATTLKRGFMLLEDGEYKKARKYFDRVLDADPENGRAYFGKLMASVEAGDNFALADRIKEGFEDLNAWNDIDEVNAMLERALEFAPDEMREVFSEDFREALFHMKGGRYHEAMRKFWRLSRYHPDAMEKAQECAQILGTTVEEALKQESGEWEKASKSMHDAWLRALDLGVQNFSGKYSDSVGLAFVRKEIAEILEGYYKGFEILGREKMRPDFKQSVAVDYRDFAFGAGQVVVYLDPSYIDYVKAGEREKREFLDDVYKMLDEACTYIEQHDKYNPSGSKDAHFREDLRRELDKYKPSQPAVPENVGEPQAASGEYVIRNTQSLPQWLMLILITVFGGFFVVMILNLLASLNTPK